MNKDNNNCTYFQLIQCRQTVLNEIKEYENYKSAGKHALRRSDESLYNAELYREKLRDLSDLCLHMADMYQPNTPIVDETNAEALLCFVHGVFWGDETEEPDHGEATLALKYLNALADEGNSYAINLLGALYSEGRYLEQDNHQAAQCYIKAAALGNSLALSNAGYCFYYGKGVDIDYEKAYQYFSSGTNGKFAF